VSGQPAEVAKLQIDHTTMITQLDSKIDSQFHERDLNKVVAGIRKFVPDSIMLAIQLVARRIKVLEKNRFSA